MIKIFSYNVNGIRSAISKGLLDWLKQEDPDIICLQEVKALEDQLDTKLFKSLGKEIFWFGAQKKGYSGVAILSKHKPKHVAYGIGIPYMDLEGRNIRLDFDTFSVMSLYLPSGTNRDRLEFKFQYMDDFFNYISELKQQIPNLLICGDYNVCHQSIDIHDPIRNKNVSGFLPEERAWFTKFMDMGFIDTFRVYHPEPHQYTWWSYRANARNNNKGWRIDYCMASEPLRPFLKEAYIFKEVVHSDHCPLGLTLSLDIN